MAISGQFSARVCSAARRLRRWFMATLAPDSEDFGQFLYGYVWSIVCPVRRSLISQGSQAKLACILLPFGS